MRIAINGMGRIGRLLFRRLLHQPDIEIVAVNDIMDPQNLAYLIKHDSVYGNSDFNIVYNGVLMAGEKRISCYRESQPSALPWQDLKIDLVLECSGKFITKPLASQHLSAGAKKVLLSTTGSDDIPLLIYGHNQNTLSADIDIISPGGCMTNCATHLVHLLNAMGIESLHLNVIHSYTSRQELVDAPHKDFRRGRSAAESIIPVQVDLAQSLERIFPFMHNRIAAVTTRVPVANGALGDFTFHLEQETNIMQVNTIFKNAAAGTYRGILEYTEEPLVSLDIKSNSHSAIVDGTLTSVIGRQVKVFAFFDNEFGYTSRVIDWLHYWKTSLIK